VKKYYLKFLLFLFVVVFLYIKLIIIRENLKFAIYLKLKEFTWKLVKIKLPVDELSHSSGF